MVEGVNAMGKFYRLRAPPSNGENVILSHTPERAPIGFV